MFPLSTGFFYVLTYIQGALWLLRKQLVAA